MIGLVLHAFHLNPISLDGISVERARFLEGRLVRAFFLVAKPGYTLRGLTVLGAEDREDIVERGAVLRGNWSGVEMGRRITVSGKLRVIDHPGRFINGQFVPPWTEIRIEG